LLVRATHIVRGITVRSPTGITARSPTALLSATAFEVLRYFQAVLVPDEALGSLELETFLRGGGNAEVRAEARERRVR
jgi:hypothetical protein